MRTYRQRSENKDLSADEYKDLELYKQDVYSALDEDGNVVINGDGVLGLAANMSRESKWQVVKNKLNPLKDTDKEVVNYSVLEENKVYLWYEQSTLTQYYPFHLADQPGT